MKLENLTLRLDGWHDPDRRAGQPEPCTETVLAEVIRRLVLAEGGLRRHGMAACATCGQWFGGGHLFAVAGRQHCAEHARSAYDFAEQDDSLDPAALGVDGVYLVRMHPFFQQNEEAARRFVTTRPNVMAAYKRIMR